MAMPPIRGMTKGAASTTATARPPIRFACSLRTVTRNRGIVLSPHRQCQPAGVLVEVNGPGRAQLRQENDLAEVHGEVLDADEDGVDDREVATLDGAPFEQRLRRQRAEHTVHFIEGLIQVAQELLPRRSVRRGEFGRAMPDVRRAAHAADHPLAHVARQMQQQVADAVRLIVRAPPEGVLGQRLNRETDLGPVFGVQQISSPVEEEAAGCPSMALA